MKRSLKIRIIIPEDPEELIRPDAHLKVHANGMRRLVFVGLTMTLPLVGDR